MSTFEIIDWGMTDYNSALEEQRNLRILRTAGHIADTLVITQHYPVLTIGRSGSENNITVNKKILNERGIDVIEVERGGDITYHGPGQLVAYPVFLLPENKRDVKKFIRAIEQVVVATCYEFNVSAVTIEGLTGVWVNKNVNLPAHLSEWSGEEKISSIGLAFKKWTSFHGVSLNVDMDLTPFSYINLCGLHGKKATSLSNAAGKKIKIVIIMSNLRLI